jgi:uncharacterized repeat protein (TIGR03803 family)
MGKLNWGMRTCGVFLLWATAAVALPAQTFTTLHSFNGTDGSNSQAALVQATNGNFYGTTEKGGANGHGTVFKITASGTLATLHSFDNTDGANPVAGLVQGTDGDFYGTTEEGGANGYGTVFKITRSGTLTTLHSFDGTDGEFPHGALVQATNGNFYGTTYAGGANGYGTVFKITPSGTLTTLHSFDNTDGANPYAAVVPGANGDFYGTTEYGGANKDCEYGCGTVFKITPSGTLTTLHSFVVSDGAEPIAGLVQGTNGDFYGTTEFGGAATYFGTVFKITPSGTLTTLHSFDGTDGYEPEAGLIQATDGNFYGTTVGNTVFKITPNGTLTTLHSFNGTDGSEPYAGLVQDTNGNLYGTTSIGGANDFGTVFSLSVGLGPFVVTQPTSGKVGAAVTILGTDLTGSTNVRFNGMEAKFTIVSASEIATMVPKGATTGPVRVITPNGKLQSNVPFRVTP